MNDMNAWYAVAVMALVTAGLRFLPFVLFGGKRQPPPIVQRLGKLLPFAIMGMLVVYCLKDVNVLSPASLLPALIASAVVVGLHAWKRSTLLSIITGTVCYMLLVQGVF